MIIRQYICFENILISRLIGRDNCTVKGEKRFGRQGLVVKFWWFKIVVKCELDQGALRPIELIPRNFFTG